MLATLDQARRAAALSRELPGLTFHDALIGVKLTDLNLDEAMVPGLALIPARHQHRHHRHGGR